MVGVYFTVKQISISGSKAIVGVRRRTPARSQSRRRRRRRDGARRRSGHRAAPGVRHRTPTRSREMTERGRCGEARRGLVALRRLRCAVICPNRRLGACEVLTETGAGGLVAQRRGRRKPPAQCVGTCQDERPGTLRIPVRQFLCEEEKICLTAQGRWCVDSRSAVQERRRD